MNDPDFEVLIVTGMSGAGRSTAARALEDAGWFVVDNLPPSLLQSTIDLCSPVPTSSGSRWSWTYVADRCSPRW
ncbi:MAG: hypothetical protein IPG68_10710 [Micrococcales bacterium]|nr:hypothetical protein [Micrococcales bacterium]